jgi:hypothetical protein
VLDGMKVGRMQPLPHQEFPNDPPVEFHLSCDGADPTKPEDFDERVFLGIHTDDCKRETQYPDKPIIRRKDIPLQPGTALFPVSFPMSLHLVSDAKHALNGKGPPCCDGDVVCLRARMTARDPQPPPPAWFLQDHGDVYESDIREHLLGKIVNWLRLDAHLLANWRPRRERAQFQRGSLQDLVRWGEADYFSYFRDAARASCVSSVIVQ